MKEFNYKINGAPYRVVVTKSDSELVELEVNGTPYTVEMAPKAKKPKAVVQRQSAPAGPAPQSSSSHLVTKPAGPAGKNTIQSPLPGVILDIRCKVGDTVKKGQTLMILEAMKMENEILAPHDCTIADVRAVKGASVNAGDPLVVLA